MPIGLTAKIEPKNDGFIGIVDADQILGANDGGGTIPDDAISSSSITQHQGSIDHTQISNVGTNTHAQIDSHISDNTIHFSDLSSFDTDDLTEGSTNLYYSDAKVDAHLSGGTGIGYSSGVISLSHLGFENLTDPDADRIPYWNDTAGTFQWKDFSNWDTAYSWGDHSIEGYLKDITGESIGDLSDVYDNSPSDKDVLVYNSTNNRYENRALVEADISDLDHYDSADFDADFSGKDTDDLSEGASHLYYTDARVGTYGDSNYLKLDGSNANSNIDIGSYNFSTTGTIWTNGNLIGGFISAIYDFTINTMSIASGSITDSTGSISFGNENLSTTGTFSSGRLTATGDGTAGIVLNQGEDSVGLKINGYDDQSSKNIQAYLNSGGLGIIRTYNTDLYVGYGGNLNLIAASNKEVSVILGDALGAKKFKILDSGWNVKVSVDSDGDIDVGGSVVIDGSGYFRPVSSADASAPNNSIYYSTTQSKLVYKDSGGTVNTLY